jgi:hypothetical protein
VIGDGHRVDGVLNRYCATSLDLRAPDHWSARRDNRGKREWSPWMLATHVVAGGLVIVGAAQFTRASVRPDRRVLGLLLDLVLGLASHAAMERT